MLNFRERAAAIAAIVLVASCASQPDVKNPAPDVHQAPVVVHRVEPVYPPELHRARYEGEVVIAGTLPKEGGALRNPHVVSSSDARFEQAALDAVSQWIWTPGLQNGEPVDVEFTTTVRFNLVHPNE